jgi:hypothetical protein
MGVLLSNTYWDEAGHCPRYIKSKKPLAGWYCIANVNARVDGLASYRQGGEGGYWEQTLQDVTAAGKKLLGPNALAALKASMKADGWIAKGAPFYRGGKWLLKFVRFVSLADTLAPGVYYDPQGKCLRDMIFNNPMPGQTCITLGMGKAPGMAAPRQEDACMAVTKGPGVVKFVKNLAPGYSLLTVHVGGFAGYATTIRGFTKNEPVLVNYIKCRTNGVISIEILYVYHK